MAYDAMSLVGDLMLGPLEGAGQKAKFYMDPLNASELAFVPGKINQIARIGRGRNNSGAAKNVMTKAGEADKFKAKNDEFNARILAIQLRGAMQKMSVASSNVADETIIVKLDDWVPVLGRRLADTAITITNESGTTTYDENTHYVMNRRIGMVKFLSVAAGAPADGATVKVDYANAEHHFTRVSGSVALPKRYAVKYDGINQASGKDCLLYIPQAVLSPEGDLALITEAFVSGDLIMTPELVSGETAPYYYDEDD